MEPLQIEQITEGLYGLRRGFSNRKKTLETIENIEFRKFRWIW